MPSEIAELKNAPRKAPKQSKLGWGLTVAKLLVRNPGAFKKLMVVGPDEPRYVRPPRAYELPAYREGMKGCTSKEKYLRPTRWCNPREPLVVAMAHELGAYELSDWEFAEAAYWWVKTKIESEILPLDGASATLRRGTGTCIHATCLWIALCRAAGIKARYKEFKTMLNDVAIDLQAGEILGLTETEIAMIPDVLNMGLAKQQGEACVDGKWIVADVGSRPELYAQSGTPILKLGEDAMCLTGAAIPGTIKHAESLPLRLGIVARALSRFAPVVTERVNVIHSGPLGRGIIEEAGGIEAYDQKARRKRMLFSEEEITRRITEASVRKSWSLEGDE
jgi:Transglutaminase-like superfamily